MGALPNYQASTDMPSPTPYTANIIDISKEYKPLTTFAKEFQSEFSGALLDLSRWTIEKKEHQPDLLGSVDKLYNSIGEAGKSISSFMRATDLHDRGTAYNILRRDNIIEKIQTPAMESKDITDILGNFGSEEGKRVFHKAKAENYFGMTEATDTAKNLYVRRVVGELGGDSEDPKSMRDAVKLAAYALNVDPKTIQNHLRSYENKIKNQDVIAFNEWEKQIKPNPELILYYEEQLKGNKEQIAPAVVDIPKPRKGRSFKNKGEATDAEVVEMKELLTEDHEESDLDHIVRAVMSLK